MHHHRGCSAALGLGHYPHSTTVTPRKSERPVDVRTASVVFFLGAAFSLGTSWVLVSRLERVGERFGLSEALLGVTAALAADAPEITAAMTALIHHQEAVGAGVVIGSNVFNLAALQAVPVPTAQYSEGWDRPHGVAWASATRYPPVERVRGASSGWYPSLSGRGSTLARPCPDRSSSPPWERTGSGRGSRSRGRAR